MCDCAKRAKKEGAKRALARYYAKCQKKREYESRIRESLGDEDDESAFYLVRAQRDGHTVVIVNVEFIDMKKPINGQGYASCQPGDEYDSEHGYNIAEKKAIRHAARQLAGLES